MLSTAKANKIIPMLSVRVTPENKKSGRGGGIFFLVLN